MNKELEYGPETEIDEDLLELCNETWAAACVEAAYEQNMIELAQMPCSKTVH